MFAVAELISASAKQSTSPLTAGEGHKGARHEKNNQLQEGRSSFLPAGIGARRRRRDDRTLCSFGSLTGTTWSWWGPASSSGAESELLYHRSAEQQIPDHGEEPGNGSGHPKRSADDHRRRVRCGLEPG